MRVDKCLDDSIKVIAALLRDVQTLRSDVFNQRSLRLTIQKIEKRCEREGISFLTKALPRLGKAFDRALSSEHIFDCTGFRKKDGTQLPRFLGELFELVFTADGKVLPNPCVVSIQHIRQILYLFYKYKLPYTTEQEHEVISSFKKTEDDLAKYDEVFGSIYESMEMDKTISHSSWTDPRHRNTCFSQNSSALSRVYPAVSRTVIRRARRLLNRVFEHFDPTDIVPSHGPGAVSTKEKLWAKWRFTSIPDRIASHYPIDQYFYCSLGHVCDHLSDLRQLKSQESPARVLLVPKDSRGPRLISCEPLENQWIQQGLGRAIVDLVEHHPLTRYNVHFTDQQPNQFGALLGSLEGKYATLDLKEASDRVLLSLVRCLFPDKVLPYLEACRSSSTQLPDGSIIKLRKFAPMGSALCFPILALTIWAILTASTEDADARESILVYGDDVIVETAHAAHAIEQLESFGLKVNHDKSCTSGFFRESCGCDAYKGVRVTPLRLRNVWSSTPSPESYSSWIAYANQFYDRKYYHTYWMIANRLKAVYRCIPSDELRIVTPEGMTDVVPSLREVPDNWEKPKSRINEGLQKKEFLVREISSRLSKKTIDGWSMLLRWFTEGRRAVPDYVLKRQQSNKTEVLLDPEADDISQPFSVSSYTKRKSTKMVFRWR